MSDEEQRNAVDAATETAANDANAGDEQDAPAETPFDNPFFLPVVLWALAVWFGWDIVTNAQAYQDYPRFNQGGFAILSVLAIYFTWSAVKEKRQGESDAETEPD